MRAQGRRASGLRSGTFDAITIVGRLATRAAQFDPEADALFKLCVEMIPQRNIEKNLGPTWVHLLPNTGENHATRRKIKLDGPST